MGKVGRSLRERGLPLAERAAYFPSCAFLFSVPTSPRSLVRELLGLAARPQTARKAVLASSARPSHRADTGLLVWARPAATSQTRSVRETQPGRKWTSRPTRSIPSPALVPRTAQ